MMLRVRDRLYLEDEASADPSNKNITAETVLSSFFS